MPAVLKLPAPPVHEELITTELRTRHSWSRGSVEGFGGQTGPEWIFTKGKRMLGGASRTRTCDLEFRKIIPWSIACYGVALSQRIMRFIGFGVYLISRNSTPVVVTSGVKLNGTSA